MATLVIMAGVAFTDTVDTMVAGMVAGTLGMAIIMAVVVILAMAVDITLTIRVHQKVRTTDSENQDMILIQDQAVRQVQEQMWAG